MHRAGPLVIGVAGGSGSGKTTVSRAILDRVGRTRIAMIEHDWYYRDLSPLPLAQRASFNFDHPDAFDNHLLLQHVTALCNGDAIQAPMYDYTSYTRLPTTRLVMPRPVVLIEGILIFTEARLRERMDIKLYVDTDADIRFIRRMLRDINERSRSLESVVDQYLTTVRPMHLEFVEPSKRYADIIIPNGGLNETAIELIVARINTLLEDE